MAVFDTQSAIRGAAAGNEIYPGYGAIAGLVIGGFIGGHKKAAEKKKLKKKQQRYARNYAALTNPKHLGEIISQFRPVFREQALTGPAPQQQAALESTLARGGFTGTGIGAIGNAISQTMPDVLSFQNALAAAGPQWDREINQFNQKALSENIGWMGQPVQHADPFGSAGALTDVLGSYGGGGMSLVGGGFKNPYLGMRPGPDKGLGGWQIPSSYTTPSGLGSFQTQYGNSNFGGGGLPYPSYQYQFKPPTYGY